MKAWRKLLDQCTRKANRERVHDLRIVTLRLQTVLENWLHGLPSDAEAAHVVRRWRRQGKKLRQALQPVRDTDVYLQKLTSLRSLVAVPVNRKSSCSPDCLREIREFGNRLKERRQAAEDELKTEIENRRERLDLSSKDLETVLESQQTHDGGPVAEAVLQNFAELATEFKDLHGGNLHDYRKRLKKIRYLAESGADPQAGRLAVTFKKMLDAIGEWHDWQALGKEAELLLPNHDKQDGLAALLETMTSKTLRRALGVCRRSTTRLIKSEGGDKPLAP